jgi:O-antigen/teichoic acid export membrane protein
VLALLLWSVPLLLMRSVMQALLIAVGRQDRVLRMTGWTALFTLALNFVLIPRWGMMAAAAMTVAGEGVRMVLAHRYVKEAGVGFGGAVRLLPFCLATAIAVGALLVFEPRSVLVGIPLGGAVYLAPFAVWAAWSRRDGTSRGGRGG